MILTILGRTEGTYHVNSTNSSSNIKVDDRLKAVQVTGPNAGTSGLSFGLTQLDVAKNILIKAWRRMDNFQKKSEEQETLDYFKRNTYVRKITALYAWLFGLPLALVAFAVDKYLWDFDEYVVCLLIGISAITFGITIAEKKANAKFGERK